MKKIAIDVCIILLLMFCLQTSLLASNKIIEPLFTEVKTSDWIAAVPDATLISELNIPATHDAFACYGAPMVPYKHICQAENMTEQLLGGVRYFDVRLRPTVGNETDGKGMFNIHHDLVFQNITFAKVLDDALLYLKKHPQEFIIMQVKSEYTPQDGAPTFQVIFDSYIKKYGAGNFWLQNSIPCVGEVRGKIVIVNRSGIGGIRVEFPDDKQDASDKYGVKFYIQDNYFAGSKQNKENEIIKAFNIIYSEKDTKVIGINFLSKAYKESIIWPKTYAQNINRDIYVYLNKRLADGAYGHYGIVLMDFFGADDETDGGVCYSQGIANLLIELGFGNKVKLTDGK